MEKELWGNDRDNAMRENGDPKDQNINASKMLALRARAQDYPPRMTRESRKLLAIRQAGELNGHSEEHDRSNQTGRSRQPIRLFSSRAFLLVFSRRPFRRGPTCA